MAYGQYDNAAYNAQCQEKAYAAVSAGMAATSYPTPCDAIARPSTGLEAVGNRLAQSIQMASVLVDRLESFEIRLTGGSPQQPGATKANTVVAPIPNGQIELMNAGMFELEERQVRMDAILSRLSGVI